MAIFIPEQVGAIGARSIHIKRSLAKLDDSYVVRTPFRPAGWAPDFFVMHPEAGWLAIAVCDTPFAALANQQLFDGTDEPADGGCQAFETLLEQCGSLAVAARLVVMWTCDANEVAQLAKRYYGRHAVRLMSRARFLEMADQLVPRLAAPLSPAAEQALMGHYFAEAEIDPACTTRRSFFRDNSATLPRCFLDHQQERAAKMDLDPSREPTGIAKDFDVRLVNGVAGSGKTLIALSRALLLAELYPEQRILMLIHNAPVVADLHARLHRARGRLPGNLEINTFSAWAHRQWRNLYQRAPHMPQSTRTVEDCISQYRGHWPELRWPASLLREEFDFINESLVTTAAQYAAANRAGRGFALRAKERIALWGLFEAVRAALDARALKLWSSLPLEICHAGEQQQMERLERFDHVLLDEAQFCAPSWFQAVRCAMTRGGTLFLCADPSQGFMRHRLSWKSVGLDVAGKTRKLRKSYRTTRAILASASQLLALQTRDDPEDYLVPDLADMEPGVKPALLYAASPQDAVERLVNEVRARVAEGVLALPDVLVIYGDTVPKGLLYDRLCRHFGAGAIWWFNRESQRKHPPGGYRRDHLRLANLETATGLEASLVLLVGVERLLSAQQPLTGDDPAQATLCESQGRKLYMAMTRAAARLIVVTSEPVPAAIADAFMAWPPDAGDRAAMLLPD